MSAPRPASPATLHPGQVVQVWAGVSAARYGKPNAEVLSVGPKAAKVRILADGTEHRIEHADLNLRVDDWQAARADEPELEVVEPELEQGPVVVIPCGAAKSPTPAPASEFYRGSYHRLALAAALALTTRDRVRILSARYGLVGLDEVLEPYDLRLGQATAVTADELVRRHGVDESPAVILAGREYARAARAVYPNAERPLEGLGGIGYQLQALARIARGEHPRPRTVAA